MRLHLNTSFATLLLFSIACLQLKAQTSPVKGDISGKVLDETGKGFPYTTVSLLNAKDSAVVKGTLSADNGTFQLNNIEPGTYVVAFYVVGYKKIYRGPFSVSAEKNVQVLKEVQLAQDSRQLKGVEIVKQKPLVERQIDKTVINVENSALSVGNNALEILQKSPGVTVDKDGNLSLRGKKGVNVMIDGKPTYLSSEQLANLLRSTGGSAIQSIELITNPSSKYDAAGNSGIINIRFKKNRNYGTNGSVLGGGGYGRFYKAIAGLTLNHREKKFNVFGNYDFASTKRFGSTDIVRLNNTATDKTYFDQTNYMTKKRTSHNYKGGLDYFINDRNTLGLAINGYDSQGANDAKILTLIGDRPSKTDSSVVARNPSRNKYTGMSVNLNFKSVIDTLGQEISFDADYSQYRDREDIAFHNQYLDAAGQTSKDDYLFRNFTPKKINIWAAKTDYTYPLNKTMKLEMGLKSSFVETDNHFVFENFTDNAWQNDARRSNTFLYNENINAAYANINRKFKTTNVQLGLRAEQTNSKGNSVTENKIVNRNYLNLFPSVFINQELSKNHDMGVSYSRRIDRPDYGSLNPFVYFVDLYSYRYGNPFLKPQYTNAFELSYSYRKTLNISVAFSRTKDVITDVLLTDTATKTIFISKQNLAAQDAYNLNVSYPVQVTKWWNTSNNFTGYYNRFSAPDIAGSPYKSGRLAFNLNTNQSVTVNKTTSIETSAYYQSRQIYGTLIIEPQYSVDLGIKKSFFEQKMDVKLAANDIFKMQRSQITSAIPSQNYVVKERWESQVFWLTCVYRFGSKDIKAARQRSGSSEAEGRRAKSQ
ncbi:outer membrane beta-barrel protein [Pedobacter sp. AW31-3R]|uniref:outer membrane beta-barrel protein n=1 Tax=Pedobacter sp. AW31-3R TaxID=3445781 RepID=UPI003F9F5AF2